MKRFLDAFVTTFLVMFLLPTALIVVSWNSLPGENMFRVKLMLEQALLWVASPSDAVSGSLQVKYAERRFSETKRLLVDQASVEGLPYLEKQVNATTKAIQKAEDPQVQKQLAQNYLNTLQTVSVELEAQRETLAASEPVPTAKPDTSPSREVYQPKIFSPDKTVEPSQKQAEVTMAVNAPIIISTKVTTEIVTEPVTALQQIDTTRQQIEQAIVIVEHIVKDESENKRNSEEKRSDNPGIGNAQSEQNARGSNGSQDNPSNPENKNFEMNKDKKIATNHN